jgi:hypothetical protein
VSARGERRLPRRRADRAGAEGAPRREGSDDAFASYVWRLIGTFRTEAGWLDLTAGRLRYTTETREVFDVPLRDVRDVVWPWYYFGGGVKLTVDREQYRFSFVLPNGAEYPTARMTASRGDQAALTLVVRKGDDIAKGRGAGKEWRRRLEAARSTAAPPPLS